MNRDEPPFAHCLQADWPAPPSVIALTTLRHGGLSERPYSSWNMADHVGDSTDAVEQNRQQLVRRLPQGAKLNWLKQIHGVEVLTVSDSGNAVEPVEADGLYTGSTLQACCIQTADCLPILLCDRAGREVAALHAGWRGVAGRIVARGVACFKAEPGQLIAWIGPGISRQHFQINRDVQRALQASLPVGIADDCFDDDPDDPDRCFADLALLVQRQCEQLGVSHISQSRRCSYQESDEFFSYRRERVTGRNTTLIMRCPIP